VSFLLPVTLQRKSHLSIPCAASVPIFKFTCVCERFIHSQDRSTYFLQQNRQIDQGNIHLYSINRSQTYEFGIEIIAAQVLFSEYLFRIFGIGSLQCMERDKQKRHRHFCFLLHFFFLHLYLRCLLYVTHGFDGFRYCLQRCMVPLISAAQMFYLFKCLGCSYRTSV